MNTIISKSFVPNTAFISLPGQSNNGPFLGAIAKTSAQVQSLGDDLIHEAR